jgi:hypothetical protein
MSSSHSPDDEDPLDSAPATSGEALTPRGGFMARPGMKTPPRHAVVVRGGDAPESEDIPLARSSFPPPPPPSAPAPPSASEKITLRAIPTPSSPPDAAPEATSAPFVASVPPVVESLPPPSDAAVVASVRGPASARRTRGSRWTIVAAAAAGLLLGFASVAARMRAADVAAQPQPVEELPRLAASVRVLSTPALASASTRANPPAEPSSVPVDDQGPTDRKASHPTSAKRSIF